MRWLLPVVLALAGLATPAWAEEDEDYLGLSTRVALDSASSDFPPRWSYLQTTLFADWHERQGRRLQGILPTNSPLRLREPRENLLKTVFYEAHRAGVNPDWVLAIMQVESAFRKYAISPVGARGYMQVMPFWLDIIGEESHNLFHLRTNIRYGTVILRHYLDIEGGDYFRALGRYNGSLGRAEYPNLVRRAYQRNWRSV